MGAPHRRADGAADRGARPAERKRLFDRGSGDLRRASADGLFRRAAHLRGLLVRVINVTPARRGRSCCGRRTRSPSYIECPLSRYLVAAARVCGAPRLRRVVGVAGPGAARARRLRRPHRSAPEASAEAKAQARARYGLDQSDRRAVPRLARRGRSARLRPLAASTTGRCAISSPSARRTPPSSRSPRSCSRPLVGLPLGIVTGSRRRGALSGAIRVGVAGAAVDAAAADVAVPGVRRGAHRLVSDRRDALGRRAGGGAIARSAAPPRRAGGGARRCRSPRCSSGCRRRR